ncbi:MAG: hypothetical protein AMXMBFR64_54690 [Myxococcales bacterium]
MGVTKRDIEIVIDEDGGVSFEVKGAPGKKCLDLTKDIEEALGVVVERSMTAEYYQQETTGQTIKVGDE